MILPRFLASDLDPAAGSASLSAEEAHHLMHVLRLRFGDEISVFDGGGREYRARIERITREGAYLRLLEEISAAPEPAVRLTLAQAVLKGDRMDEVVRDATMMGATAIEPMITERTVVRLNGLGDGRAADRWRRIAIASAKQCRRAVLPSIGDGIELAEWLLQDDAERRLMLVEPSAGVETRPVTAVAGDRPASASLLVGPEGGWSTPEIESAVRAGFTPITLGRRTLRADAVTIVAIAVLQHVWGDL
jgi:16S rRNA (uracil1498-N3)-methyltransferase